MSASPKPCNILGPHFGCPIKNLLSAACMCTRADFPFSETLLHSKGYKYFPSVSGVVEQ